MDQQPKAVQSVTAKHDAVLQLVGYFHESYPGLHLDPNTLQKIADYHLALDCDFYWLSPCA